MKRSIGILCLGVLFLSGAVLGQTTLTGYTNSVSVQGLSSQQVYEKMARWRDIIDPNLDVLPSQEETDIYRELVRAEGGGGLTTDFSSVGGWDYSGRCKVRLQQIQLTKDLYWLPALLDSADALLAIRKKAGYYTPTTGRGIEYDCWIATHENDRLAPLNSGRAAWPIALAARWILDNPELYTQAAPTNAVIPLAVPDGTYYDRAKFYLLELKKSMEVFRLSGLWWEFDTTAEAGWIFEGTQGYGADLKALYPNGIDVADVQRIALDEEIRMLAYNRTLSWLAAYYQTALGLHRIDQIEGTSLHDAFYTDALETVRKSGNWWRYQRQEVQEPLPNGTHYTWSYGAGEDSSRSYEDSTHLEMDLDPMTQLIGSGFFTGDDLKGVSGSIYSRWFDHEAQVFYTNMKRTISRHSITEKPQHGYWWLTPGYLGWVGEFGSPLQARGLVALSLEMLDDQMRKCEADPSYRSSLLGRADTRRSRNAKGPFEIYNLKMARAARGLTPTGNSAAPVIDSVSPSPSFSIPESTPLGTVIGSVSASDADAGETVSYWITKGNVANRFKIDPITGEIRVNKYYPLNDEEGGSVTPLEITVMDDGVPMQLVTTNITITLQDDRSSPHIVEGQVARFTPNLLRGDPVMMVNVEDPVTNKFFLDQTSDLFTVDSDGSIRMKKQGGTPGQHYTLKIGVTQELAEPLISFGYVTLVCEKSFVDSSVSATSGAAPLTVNFSCSHKEGGTIVSADWDFGDGTITHGVNVAHTYQDAGMTHFVSVEVVDQRGVRDRATTQSVAVQGTSTPPNGLLAHYRFSEGSGSVAYDSSGLGNHGTSSGDGYDASSPVGTGFQMGGSRYVKVPSSVYSQISDAVTISFYAKGAYGLYDWNHPVYAADSGGGKRIGVHLPWGGSYILDAGDDRLIANIPIPKVDVWTLWTFTKDAATGEMAIYTNGVQAARTTGKTRSMSGITQMYIGCRSPGSNVYNGSMDEVRIYNRALSASEVATLAQSSPLAQTFQLDYSTGPEGTLRGASTQTIAAGGNGQAVYAEPNSSLYQFFAQWSDGRTDNPRMDLNVQRNLSVSATYSNRVGIVSSVLELIPDVINSDSGYNGSSVLPTVNDPFNYSIDTPTSPLPSQVYSGGRGFHGAGSEGADVTLVYTLNQGLVIPFPGDTIVVDLYGRNMLAERNDDMEIQFYNGGLTGTLVTNITGLALGASYHARAECTIDQTFDTLVVVGHDSTVGGGNSFTLMEIRAARIPGNQDGDALNNEWERVLGTDPNDPSSFFQISDVKDVNGNVQVSWPSASGVQYRIWESNDLTNWNQIRGWADPTSTPKDHFSAPSKAKSFYKIEAQLAP